MYLAISEGPGYVRHTGAAGQVNVTMELFGMNREISDGFTAPTG